MEKTIMNTLLNMYTSGDLSETTGTDIDDAYSETDNIIEQFKTVVPRLGKDKALDDAINRAISTGSNYGFLDGVKVGLALYNVFSSKSNTVTLQKISKAVKA